MLIAATDMATLSVLVQGMPMKTLTSSLAIQSWCFREFKTSQKMIKGL
jgi:hypothetical protein